jgi:uncharacterized membrane protein
LGELSRQIVIGAPVDRVYQYVSDPRNAPRYISSINRILSGPEGPVAMGQTWKAEAHFLGQPRLLNLRVAQLVPNSRVQFVLDGDPQASLLLRLVGDDEGQNSAVSLTIDVVGVPTLLVTAVLGALFTEDLKRLKNILEQ